jgi:hypothetical protein
MDKKDQIMLLSDEELVKTSGGGILFEICIILYQKREMIWDAVVEEYFAGFREGYNKATNV